MMVGPVAKHDSMMRGLDRYPTIGSFCQAWLNDAGFFYKAWPNNVGSRCPADPSNGGFSWTKTTKFGSYFHKDSVAVGLAHIKIHCYWVLVITRSVAVGSKLQEELIKVGSCCHKDLAAVDPAASPNYQQDPLLLGIVVNKTQQQWA
jgi:hypothetical protein